MQAIMDKADNYWAANQVENQVSSVTTPVVATTNTAVPTPVTATCPLKDKVKPREPRA